MISRLKDRVSKSGANNDKAFIRTVLLIMKEVGYTYDEVLKLPIPVYMEIVDFLEEVFKKRKDNGKK